MNSEKINEKINEVEIIIENDEPEKGESENVEHEKESNNLTQWCKHCKKFLSKDLFCKLPHIKQCKKSSYRSCLNCRLKRVETLKPLRKSAKELISCDCGFVIKRSQMYKHNNSANHIIRMALKKIQFEPDDPIIELLKNTNNVLKLH